MKKLMIALAAAATTMFSFGDLPTGTSFEAAGISAGPVTVGDIVNKDDTGDQDGEDKYWYSTDAETEELGAITNDVASQGVSRPDMFLNTTQSKSLYLETSSSPLVRTALPNTGATSVTPVTIDGEIYLDTLVKFTPADSAFAEDLTGGDKIAIEYVEHESEGEGDVGFTNFVVRAGYIGANELGQTNYFAAVPAGFDKDAWHRLTVRTIADVGDGHVGFVIYLDGDMTNTLEYATTVDAGFGNLNALAQTFYNNEKHALFPSAVEASDIGGDAITSVAFSGNGFIDDVSFTATKPTFINEAVVVTVTWDTNKITQVALNGGSALAQEDWEKGTYDIEPVDGAVSFAVEFAQGYVLGECAVTSGSGGWNGSTAFTNLSAGAVCNIGAMFPLYEVNGVAFDDLEDALTAAAAGTAQNPATLKLLANCGEGITLGAGTFVIIDLAGHDIQGTDADSFSIACKLGANVWVTNSIPATGAVKVSLMEDATAAMQVKDEGTVVSVYDTKFEGYISVKDDGDLKIYSGIFYDDDAAGVVEDFRYNAYIQGTPTVTALPGGYFQVGGGEEPPAPVIPNYTLTIPDDVVGATAAVTSNGVAVADLTAIPSNTEVLVTWTAESGYKITAGATETITMDDDKTAGKPTVAAITYATLTITPVANCTIVVSNATAEVASGATFDVDDAVELTVYRTPADGYELDNCAATETITMDADRTVTAAVKQSGGSYPTYIDNITDPTTKAAYEAKYDVWKTTYGADTESAYEDAFLLNCSPDTAVVAAEKAAFKFTKIAFEGGVWVTETTTKNTSDENYNGTVTVKRYSDVGCKTEDTNGSFFKAELK